MLQINYRQVISMVQIYSDQILLFNELITFNRLDVVLVVLPCQRTRDQEIEQFPKLMQSCQINALT